MLSHNIEIENLRKQLEDVNEEISTIQKDIQESQTLLRLKEIRLESKENLKRSIENKLRELNTLVDIKSEHTYTGYMDSVGFDKRDQKFENNNKIIDNNSKQIDDLNNQINNSKNSLTKVNLKLKRKKFQVYNNILNGKNIFLDKKQRMYLTVSRNINKLENMPENFSVSVNNIKIRNVKEKYENQIERTYNLEKNQKKLQEEGHKIKSKVLGKVVEFYTKSDNKTKEKYHKLLQIQSEFLVLDSARQFYDPDYKMTRNQKRVLAGESLKHEDIINNIIQLNGQNYLQDKNGDLELISNDIFMKTINSVTNNTKINVSNDIIEPTREEPVIEPMINEEVIEQKNEDKKENHVLIENSIEEIKNVGRYGKIIINKQPKNDEMVNNVNRDSNANEHAVSKDNVIQFPNSNKYIEQVVNESKVQKNNIIQFPNLNTEEYNNLVNDMMEQNNFEQETEKGRAM